MRTHGRTASPRAAAHDEAARLPSLLDVDGVADVLGVSTRYVRRLVAERRIPYIKWGRYLRFDPEELAAWIDESRVATYDPRTARQSRTAG
jgi:excisionase family DNA binding protein